MTIKFVIMVNKQGQTRLASYFDWIPMAERSVQEAEIIRKCLSRSETQCSFVEHRGMQIIYRRYASLFFIVGCSIDSENELGVLEFIHARECARLSACGAWLISRSHAPSPPRPASLSLSPLFRRSRRDPGQVL